MTANAFNGIELGVLPNTLRVYNDKIRFFAPLR